MKAQKKKKIFLAYSMRPILFVAEALLARIYLELSLQA